jgi:hypothetical protein
LDRGVGSSEIKDVLDRGVGSSEIKDVLDRGVGSSEIRDVLDRGVGSSEIKDVLDRGVGSSEIRDVFSEDNSDPFSLEELRERLNRIREPVAQEDTDDTSDSETDVLNNSDSDDNSSSSSDNSQPGGNNTGSFDDGFTQPERGENSDTEENTSEDEEFQPKAENLEELSECHRILLEQGIWDENKDQFKRNFRLWILRNHPDKINGDQELVQKVNNCVSIVNKDFDEFKNFARQQPQQHQEPPQEQPQEPQEQPQEQPQEPPQEQPQEQPQEPPQEQPQEQSQEQPQEPQEQPQEPPQEQPQEQPQDMDTTDVSETQPDEPPQPQKFEFKTQSSGVKKKKSLASRLSGSRRQTPEISFVPGFQRDTQPSRIKRKPNPFELPQTQENDTVTTHVSETQDNDTDTTHVSETQDNDTDTTHVSETQDNDTQAMDTPQEPTQEPTQKFEFKTQSSGVKKKKSLASRLSGSRRQTPEISFVPGFQRDTQPSRIKRKPNPFELPQTQENDTVTTDVSETQDNDTDTTHISETQDNDTDTTHISETQDNDTDTTDVSETQPQEQQEQDLDTDITDVSETHPQEQQEQDMDTDITDVSETQDNDMDTPQPQKFEFKTQSSGVKKKETLASRLSGSRRQTPEISFVPGFQRDTQPSRIKRKPNPFELPQIQENDTDVLEVPQSEMRSRRIRKPSVVTNREDFLTGENYRDAFARSGKNAIGEMEEKRESDSVRRSSRAKKPSVKINNEDILIDESVGARYNNKNADYYAQCYEILVSKGIWSSKPQTFLRKYNEWLKSDGNSDEIKKCRGYYTHIQQYLREKNNI